MNEDHTPVHVVRGRLALAQGNDGEIAIDEAELTRLLSPEGRIAITREASENAVAQALGQGGFATLDQYAEHHAGVEACADVIRRIWGAEIALDSTAPTRSDERLGALARLADQAREILGPDARTAREMTREATRAVRDGSTPLPSKITVHGRAIRSSETARLVEALCARTVVQWRGARALAPLWTHRAETTVVDTSAAQDRVTVRATGCATPAHEALEAMRWIGAMVRGGATPAEQIAVAIAGGNAHGPHIRALRESAGLALHECGGTPALENAEGQAVAALVVLAEHGARARGLAKRLEHWWGPDAAQTALAANDGDTHAAARTLAERAETAIQSLWTKIEREAERRGTTLRRAIEAERSASEAHACESIALGSLDDVADAERAHLWIMGMDAEHLPRRTRPDETIISATCAQAIGLSTPDAATAAHSTMRGALATTSDAVLSYARRDADGRRRSASPLVTEYATKHAQSRRSRTPDGGTGSPADAAIGTERFARSVRGRSTNACAAGRRQHGLSAYDGMIRADHEAVEGMLARPQSPSSLAKLLRNPLGYLWRYGLGWDEPAETDASLGLDARRRGNLIHEIIEHATIALGGPGRDDADVRTAVAQARAATERRWRDDSAEIPAQLWTRTLDRAQALARWTLGEGPRGPNAVTWTAEVAVRGERARNSEELPALKLTQARLRIEGRIDRVDRDANGHATAVIDYKTGRRRLGWKARIDGGAELQRALYAAAAEGGAGAPQAWLVYVGSGDAMKIEDPLAALATLDAGVTGAVKALRAGYAPAGPDSGGMRDGLRFALGTQGLASYRERKESAIAAALGPTLVALWEQP